MSSPPTKPKVCIRCGEDCSARPRTKDQQGRYTCKQCADEAAAKALAPNAKVEAAPPALAPPPAAPVVVNAPDEEIFLVEEEPTRKPGMPEGACPSCGVAMALSAMVCTSCGLSRAQPGQAKTPSRTKPKRKGLACPGCGYNLDGLRTLKCPECGETISESAIKRHQRAQRDRKAVILAYLAPSILLIGGLAVAVTLLAGPTSALTIVPFLVLFAIQFVIAFIIYIMCAMRWIGMASSVHLSALQLAASLAVMEALRGSVLWMTGGRMHWLWYAMIMVIVVLTMAKLMDLDWEDAAIVGTIIVLAWILIPLFLLAAGWV